MSAAAAYLLVFLGSLGVDIIPFIGPPAWMVMVFFQMKYDLNPWFVLVLGVAGSVLGRFTLGLYIPRISNHVIKQRKNRELHYLGQKLDQKRWRGWLFVLVYSLLPLSTTALFSAAGIARVSPWLILPPFTVGKFVSDAIMLFSGRKVAVSAHSVLEGAASPKSIIIAVLGLVIVFLLLVLDETALIRRKKLAFNFRIWK
jgi:membrane protein YqaA with SNARE-associated domain